MYRLNLSKEFSLRCAHFSRLKETYQKSARRTDRKVTSELEDETKKESIKNKENKHLAAYFCDLVSYPGHQKKIKAKDPNTEEFL